MHKVTKFGFTLNSYEIRTKFVRTSHKSDPIRPFLSSFMASSHETSCGSLLIAFTGSPCSPSFWAPTPINKGGPQEQDLKNTMCNVQKVIVVEKDVTSIANFAKWGGRIPHVV